MEALAECAIEILTERAFEILGTVVGVLYLYYEFRADRRVWVAGIIMPALSLFVYWRAGLYADFGINVYYFLTALYGWYVWRYGKAADVGQEGEELPITHTPTRCILPLAAALAGSFVLIGWGLSTYTDSNVSWLDSFTTALSIVGMWMLARKWLEQWLVWLVVDAVSVGLYIYKGVYFYAALYALYTVVAWFGYLAWKAKMGAKG